MSETNGTPPELGAMVVRLPLRQAMGGWTAQLEPLPKGTDLVIVSYNLGQGCVPFMMCLPHQVSLSLIRRMLPANLSLHGVQEIVVDPVNSRQRWTLAERPE
jgi:hypothetical protein